MRQEIEIDLVHATPALFRLEDIRYRFVSKLRDYEAKEVRPLREQVIKLGRVYARCKHSRCTASCAHVFEASNGFVTENWHTNRLLFSTRRRCHFKLGNAYTKVIHKLYRMKRRECGLTQAFARKLCSDCNLLAVAAYVNGRRYVVTLDRMVVDFDQPTLFLTEQPNIALQPV